MHELAIVENIIEIIVPKAKSAGAKKIVGINMKIGELSGVIPKAITDCFETASVGTICEGAKFSFEAVPAKIHCNKCGYDGPVDRKKAVCPGCGSACFSITGGRDYFVESIEAE